MIVKYDALSSLEKPNFTLCNPGSVYNDGILTKVIGTLVDHEAEEIIFNFNSTSELNLRVNKVKRDNEEENEIVNNLFRSIQNRRLLFVDNIGYFVITSTKDGFGESHQYKDIRAESVDTEIAQKKVPFILNGTYRFQTDIGETETIKGIIDIIVERLPLWTIEYIDPSVGEKYRTFEDIDTEINCLSFLLENIQDAYECIVITDCINRTLNIYSQYNYVKRTDIHITRNDVINSLDIEENADDLYTALSAFGNNELTISAINPLGGNVIYNFDYYLDWMSDDLRVKVENWQNDIKNAQESYYNLNRTYYEKLDEALNNQMELDRIDMQISLYTRCRDNIVAEQDVGIADNYNSAIEEYGGTAISIALTIEEALNSIDSKLNEKIGQRQLILENIDAINVELENSLNSIRGISEPLSFDNVFVQSEIEELNHFIYEGTHRDEYITTTDIMSNTEILSQMKILYDRAVERLKRISEPTQEFSIDAENFLFVKEFSAWSEQLETGCLINVEIEENDIALLFLSTISVNYEDLSLSLTFGNRFNKFDPKSLFENMLGKISKSANTLNYVKEILYPIKSGEFNYMKEALQNSRNITATKALSSKEEEVVIDNTGYTGRRKREDGSYDPYQIKIVGKNIVFTNDSWETSILAIGEIVLGTGDNQESVYGINAEAIIGDIIMGNNLRILDDRGQDLLTVVDGKIESRVEGIEGSVTSIQQTAEGINFRVEALENTEFEIDHVKTANGYTFNSEGLNIYRAGDEIKNLLDNTGMYVSKVQENGNSDEEILTANNEGVNAINLTARQYLITGKSSRFEDYGDDRTGCFFIGG